MGRKQRTWQLALIFSGLAAASEVHSAGAHVVSQENSSEAAAGAHVVSQENLSEAEVDASSGNVVIDGNENSSTAVEVPPHLRECGIWLAPSAIPGSGLGMYAGKDYKKDENLQLLGDLVIPIVDRSYHNQEKDFTFLWEEYVWNGRVVGTDVEGVDNADGASPGFGSVANSFLPVFNVEEGVPKRDTAGLHRSKDPGAGAFTSYYDRQSTARRDIAAGEEFYVDYGDHWFEVRAHFGPIPLYDHLDKATHLFLEYERLKSSNVSESIREELWDTFIRKTVYNDSRVFGSFHHNDKEELNELAKVKSLSEIRINQAKRSTEWLLEHGTCGDLIYGDNSTLKQAGRGAFASIDLPEGVTVTQLPLIHITNRSRLDMYNFVGIPRLPGYITGKRNPQLMLNYCYGHNESTLLLCPYGPVANYVNHNQTLANVKIVWGDPVRSNFMPHLLNDSLDTLERDATAKLAFDMVTTRPIAKGEELFLDYGESWEQAWQAHLESWEPVQDDHMSSDDFVSKYANDDYGMYRTNDDYGMYRTVFELIERPYPSNLMLQCNGYFRSEGRQFSNKLEFLEHEMADYNNDWFPCEILRRKRQPYRAESPFLYAAVDPTIRRSEEEIMERLPAIAFRFREKPYTSDMFLDHAFRHEIHIPDEIFPEAWRNVKH